MKSALQDANTPSPQDPKDSQGLQSTTSVQKVQLDSKLDPDSDETKNEIRDMMKNYPRRDTNDDKISNEFCVESVFASLRNRGAPYKHCGPVIQCLYQHFVGWDLLNSRILLYNEDCVLTYSAFCAPWLIIPLLELVPPKEYQAIDANILGEYNLPAVSWVVQRPDTLLDTTVFNKLVGRTSDATLRLCIHRTDVGYRTAHPLLHALLRAWDYARRVRSDDHFAESVQLLLDRADDDGGGGIDLRVVDADGRTAPTLMAYLAIVTNSSTHESVTWRQTHDLLDSATTRAFEYGDKLLPALSFALENSLIGIKPLCMLIASYSPASIGKL